ncbi:MAG: transcription antitermination factor NusB [bacterium]
MGIRRAGRIIALQSLYQIDLGGSTEEQINNFIENYEFLQDDKDSKKDGFLEKSKEFAAEMVKTYFDNKEQIDGIIPLYLKNWTFDRILAIDRNILRLGVAELFFREDIPYKVTINEGIELAKKFGDEKSGSFVNGVLDNIVKHEAPKYPLLVEKMKNEKKYSAKEKE